MGVRVGTRLGPYDVIAPLGVGGMGEVYRARDRRLGRDVAIKVLPEDVAADPERLRRFEIEARAAGSLNHPNVLAIYDVGLSNDAPYFVSELLEGLTLRERMRQGGLTVSKLLELATQAASGLAAAHAKGIVHRDLKPENLFVTSDGRVKILDFGLATSEMSSKATVLGPTISSHEPVRVGTTAYMSPEQIRGLRPDHRSDVFSLGVTLYEALALRHPFLGDTAADTMSAILREDPAPLTASNPGTPPSLERLIRRCLEKRPEDRFQSTHDLALALESLSSLEPADSRLGKGAPDGEQRTPSLPWRDDPLQSTPLPLSRRTGGLAARPRRIFGVASLVALLAVSLFWLTTGRSDRPPAVSRLRPVTSYPGAELQPALSSEGTRVAFQWRGLEGNDDIYVKLVNEEPPLRLTDDHASECCPIWSPDGQRVAYLRTNGPAPGIYEVPSLGGRERLLHPAEAWFGSALSWTPDGAAILYSASEAPGEPPGIRRLWLETLESEPVTRPPPTAAGDALPVVSPDGRRVAFSRLETNGDLLMVADVFVAPTDGGDTRRLTSLGRFIGGLAWTPDGREILFSSRSAEMVELRRVGVSGGDSRPSRTPWPAGVDRNFESLYEPSRGFRISASPAGLLFSSANFDLNIWRFELSDIQAAGAVVASTFNDAGPCFSPDGSQIGFNSRRSGDSEVWVCSDEGADCTAITAFHGHSGSPSWSPDGRSVAVDARPQGNADVYLVDVGSHRSRRLTRDPAEDVLPSWSVDGQWVYFSSDRSGRWEIWKRRAGGESPAIQVTRDAGFSAAESHDGRWLYHSRIDEPGLWRCPVSGGESQLVTETVSCWGHWALGNQGVYTVRVDLNGPFLERLRWEATTSETLGRLPTMPGCSDRSLAISPDELSALVVQTDLAEGDLLLLEGSP